MKKLTDLKDQSLKWSQPALLRREYELRAGPELVGTLRFRSSFGTLATAECADGSWTFKRTGFWQTQVTVRVAGAESDLAVFRNRTWSGGGILEFRDGPRFRATNKTWQTRYEFRTDRDELLFTFKPGGWSRQTAEVEMTPKGWETAELPILIMLGWYLAMMTQADASAAATVTVMAASTG